MVVPDLTISNPAGAGFVENLFGIRLLKLMASTTLSAVLKRQCSSVLPCCLHHCLPVFDEICGIAMNFVFFFVRVTLIKQLTWPDFQKWPDSGFAGAEFRYNPKLNYFC